MLSAENSFTAGSTRYWAELIHWEEWGTVVF